MNAKLKTTPQEVTSLQKVHMLHDAVGKLVAERERLNAVVEQQQKHIAQLRDRCERLDQNRATAKDRIEHLMQQLPS